MTTTLPSLINPEQAQQDLPIVGASFFDESISAMVDAHVESRGDHTAAHLFLKNPQVYKAIMFMYASGTGQLKVAEVLKVSVHTVRAVIQREKLTRGAAMDTAKTLQAMSDLREMTIETLIEKLADPEERAKIPFDKLMIGLGIQTEKIELLRGNATERIEHVDATPASEAFDRWLKEGAIDAESHETGLSMGECGTKGERVTSRLLAPAAHDLGDPAAAPAPGASDSATAHDALQNIDYVGLTSEKPNVCSVFKDDDVTFAVSSVSSNGIRTGQHESPASSGPVPDPDPAPAPTHRGGGGHVLPPTQQGAMNE
jgi:hypothetical protein